MMVVGTRTLPLLLLLVGLAGCTHPVLGRPVIIGASASNGVGATVPEFGPAASAGGASATHSGGSPTNPRELPVNAAVAYRALVKAPHREPINLSDSGAFVEPMASLNEQIEAAVAQRPSVVIGIDALFWPVQQPIPLNVPEAERHAMRLAALEEALAKLDRLQCVVVVGDIPLLRTPGVIPGWDERRLDDETVAAINARIEAWSRERPNRAVVRVSELMDAVEQCQPIEVGCIRLEGDDVRELLQSDRLHPSGRGTLLLVASAVAALEQEGVIEPGLAVDDQDRLLARLVSEAKAASQRSQPTIFQSMTLSGLKDRLDAELKRGDDAAAAETLDRILTRLASLDRNPLGENDAFIGFGLGLARLSADERRMTRFDSVWRRHWRSLEPNALADRANPWRFQLWLDLGHHLGKDSRKEMAERLAECRERIGEWEEPRGSMVWEFLVDSGAPLDLVDRAFPNIQVPLELERRRADSRLDLNRRIAMMRPAGSPVRAQWENGIESVSLARLAETQAGKGYLLLMHSDDPATRSDREARVREFTESVGHGRLLAALERQRLLDDDFNAKHDSERREACRVGVFCYGSAKIVESADPSQHHARSLLVPLVLSTEEELLKVDPEGRSRSVRFARNRGGFGWLEGMDGAAANIDGRLVTTRVNLTTGALEQAPESEDLAATFWVQPWTGSLVGDDLIGGDRPRLGGGGSGTVETTEFPDRRALEDAIIAGLPVVAASAEDSNRKVSRLNGFTTELRGRVASASVRIPAGVDESRGAIRWIERRIENAPVVVLGVAGRSPGCPAWSTLPDSFSESAPRRSRFHVVWEENGVWHTGELIEWTDLQTDSQTTAASARSY